MTPSSHLTVICETLPPSNWISNTVPRRPVTLATRSPTIGVSPFVYRTVDSFHRNEFRQREIARLLTMHSKMKAESFENERGLPGGKSVARKWGRTMKSGGPEEARTPNLYLRRVALYPIELRALNCATAKSETRPQNRRFSLQFFNLCAESGARRSSWYSTPSFRVSFSNRSCRRRFGAQR